MLLLLDDVLNPELSRSVATRVGERPGPGAPGLGHEADILLEGLCAHPLFVLGVQPRRCSRPTFSRHDERGPAAAIMNDLSSDFRTDVAVTVFLSDPSAYQGGELLLDTGFGEEPYKQRAGSCVVYPASARRRVAAVTSGAAVTGEVRVQSLIRESERRQILYDVGCSRRCLELFGGGRGADVAKLTTCEESLLRLWSEP